MTACVCGFEAETEGDLMSHFLECHRLSYGLEVCSRVSEEEAPEARLAAQG